MVSKISVLLVLAFAALGWTALNKIPSSPSDCPGHPNHCYDKDTKSYYEVGSTQTRKGSCERIECLEDFSMELATCEKIGELAGCKLTEVDLSKPYPDCCPQIDCD